MKIRVLSDYFDDDEVHLKDQVYEAEYNEREEYPYQIPFLPEHCHHCHSNHYYMFRADEIEIVEL